MPHKIYYILLQLGQLQPQVTSLIKNIINGLGKFLPKIPKN